MLSLCMGNAYILNFLFCYAVVQTSRHQDPPTVNQALAAVEHPHMGPCNFIEESLLLNVAGRQHNDMKHVFDIAKPSLSLDNITFFPIPQRVYFNAIAIRKHPYKCLDLVVQCQMLFCRTGMFAKSDL